MFRPYGQCVLFHIFQKLFFALFSELQLKPDHKPIQHLNDWKRKIVGMLTDMDPSREDPQLFWRRDAILSITDERKVRNKIQFSLPVKYNTCRH